MILQFDLDYPYTLGKTGIFEHSIYLECELQRFLNKRQIIVFSLKMELFEW